MEITLTTIIVGFIWLGVGVLASILITNNNLRNARSQADEIMAEANKRAEQTKQKYLLEAKEGWFKVRDEKENRVKDRQKKLDQVEHELLEKEKQLGHKENEADQRANKLKQAERNLQETKEAQRTKESELNRIIREQNNALSRISQVSLEDAKELLLENLKRDYKAEAADIYKELVDRSKENATKEARKIITMAIEKNAADHCLETTVSVVPLPSDELKGRIIGRDGRNIKAFEQATNVKVIVDDTPEAVVLSGFDPVRREIARLALQKVISNSKINSQKIEEIVKNAEKEVDKLILRAGNETVARVGVRRMNQDVIKI